MVHEISTKLITFAITLAVGDIILVPTTLVVEFDENSNCLKPNNSILVCYAQQALN